MRKTCCELSQREGVARSIDRNAHIPSQRMGAIAVRVEQTRPAAIGLQAIEDGAASGQETAVRIEREL